MDEELIEIEFRNHIYNKGCCRGCQEYMKSYNKRYPGMNARFLNEAKQIEGRWAKSGLLEGISDRWVRSTTAVLLEGQRLMNERMEFNNSD